MHLYGMGSKGPSPWRKSEDFEFLEKEYLGYRHNQEGHFYRPETDDKGEYQGREEGRRAQS